MPAEKGLAKSRIPLVLLWVTAVCPGNRLVLLSLALALAGCAPMHWEHPNKAADMLQQDQEDCEAQARAWVPRPLAPPPVVTFSGTSASVRMADESSMERQYAADLYEAVQRCLRERGWSLKRN